MKNLRTFEEFLYEKKMVNHSKTVKSLEDLMKAIDELPNTIQYVKVPDDLNYIKPSQKKITPKMSSWNKRIEKILKNTLKLEGGEKVDQFQLKSYFGFGTDLDPYYIELSTPISRKLSNKYKG